MPIYVVKTTIHNMPGVELIGGDELHHQFLRHCTLAQYATDEAYLQKQDARPFLQGHNDKPLWTLVEFWNSAGVDQFLTWINEQVEKNTEYYQRFLNLQKMLKETVD